MSTKDLAGLIHPVIAVVFIFPLIGMTVYYAWQARQRRLQTTEQSKSKLPPSVGPEHLKLGRWLSGGVVGLSLIGLAYPIFSKMAANQTWTAEPFRVIFILLIFVSTIASLVLLYRAKPKVWRAIFATLTGMGLIILGSQPEIFRRTNEWYVSHYYYGMAAACLMIFSLAIVQDIYQDRKNRWRYAHVILNCIALLLFVGQGFTGTRDLLEIPLSWQQPYIEQLYIQQCQTQPCTVQPGQ
jgi:drug/metabolite transporter (DMT)-like permease